MIETVHFITRIVEIDGQSVRARYFGQMDDREFQRVFINGRRETPKGWKIVHVPLEEVRNGSSRMTIIEKMPLLIRGGYYASYRNDLNL